MNTSLLSLFLLASAVLYASATSPPGPPPGAAPEPAEPAPLSPAPLSPAPAPAPEPAEPAPLSPAPLSPAPAPAPVPEPEPKPERPVEKQQECKNDRAYQIIVLMDVSSWYKEIKTSIVEGLFKFLSKFDKAHPHSRFLLTSFSDYPLPPYGCAVREDHCFKRHSRHWTGPRLLKHLMEGIKANWGLDETESVDTALNHIAHSTDLFTEEDTVRGKTVERIVIVVSDEGYHQGKTLKNPPMAFKCQWGEAECCKPYGLAEEPKDYSAFTFVPNRNAKDNFVECGFDKEGKYTGVFEDFPDQSAMYAKLGEKKISVLGLIGGKGYKKWTENYAPLAAAASSKFYVADWSDKTEDGATTGLDSLLQAFCNKL